MSLEPYPVIASMATFPGRAQQCLAALESLLPQVDALYAYWNGPGASPPFGNIAGYESRGLTWRFAESNYGDVGDVGKIAAVDDECIPGCIRLLCDDDIVYPSDYVVQMRAALARHPGAVVGVHGKIIPHAMRDAVRVVGPIASFYRSLVTSHCTQELGSDTPVHILGTGTMAYATDILRINWEMCPVPNMADIWCAMACERQGVERFVIPRRKGWIHVLPCEDTIWDRAHRDGDALQTALVNAVPWKPLG
jgi:hypothetical protein